MLSLVCALSTDAHWIKTARKLAQIPSLVPSGIRLEEEPPYRAEKVYSDVPKLLIGK